MKFSIYARHELADHCASGGTPLVLMEGSWPAGQTATNRWALDDVIDRRFEWIDLEAERLSQECFAMCQAARQTDSVDAAWLNALALRYYLVKLIRPIAFFTQVQGLGGGDRLEVVAERNRDEDYVNVMMELVRCAGADAVVRWRENRSVPSDAAEPGRLARRWATRLTGLLEPHGNGATAGSRVVLRGNPQLLGPICRELVDRNASVWWLYDRFAFRSWLRWRRRGVGHLVCESADGSNGRLAFSSVGRLDCRQVDLRGPVNRWLRRRIQTHGRGQERILAAIDAHFRTIRPDVLLADEDATPMGRAAVAAAERYAARSYVLQHGAPCCRFGFAPVAADRFLAWGPSSREQLCRWGVPSGTIHITGSPRHDALDRVLSRRWSATSDRPGVLLVATVPPRDERPDAAALHLTRRSYAEMLRWACQAVTHIPHARFFVKLHPRAPEDPIARDVLSGYPRLKTRIVRTGTLGSWLRRVDCVLSCISSAGVDATLSGLPVIQILPAGCGDILPHDRWGMLGTARSAQEVQRLLRVALWDRPTIQSNPTQRAFSNLDGSATARIADIVLDKPRPPKESATCDRLAGSGGLQPSPVVPEDHALTSGAVS